MTVGNMIEKLMQVYNIKSIRELDRITGVSNTYLGNLIKGKDPRSGKPMSPTIDMLKQICDGLNYPLEVFLAETGYISSTVAAANALPEDEAELLAIYRKMDTYQQRVALDLFRTLPITLKVR